MKHFKLAALSVAFATLAAGTAYAADGKLDRGDARFLQKAAQSGQLEIQASKLAVERAQNPQVKEFAQKMVTDHTAVDKELRALAQSKQVELKDDLRWGQGRTLKGLQDEKGDDFDEEYVDDIAVDAHEDAVELFEDAAEDVEDADIKAFAVKTLPHLKQHLEMGRALDDAIDDQPKGVRNTPASTTLQQDAAPGAATTAPGMTPSSTGATGTGAAGTGTTGSGVTGTGAPATSKPGN